MTNKKSSLNLMIFSTSFWSQTILAIIILLYLISKLTSFATLPYPNRDEVGIAYSAYSIAETGRDEWGTAWPLVFKSIGDYKSPVLIYLAAIPALFLGPQLIAVRGIILLVSLIALWPITRFIRLFSPRTKNPQLWAALALFLPWFYHFSRSGYEAFLAMVINLFILYFLLTRGLTWWVGLLMGLSILTYSSSLVVIPPLLLLYLVLQFRNIAVTKSKIPLAYLTGSVIVVLAIVISLGITTNKKQVTVFSDPTTLTQYRQARVTVAENNPILAKLWYNRPVYLSRVVAANYLKTASPNFVFFAGGSHPWHKTGFSGHLFPIFMILSALGFYFIICRSSLTYSQKLLLVGWLAVALLPSAITIDAPHATRSLNFFALLSIFGLIGLAWLSLRLKPILYLFLATLLILIALYQLDYHVVYAKTTPDGLPQGLIETIKHLQQTNPKSIIYLDQPNNSWYLYAGLYTPIAPHIFQSSVDWSVPSVVGLQYARVVGRFKSFTPAEILNTIQPRELVITQTPQLYPSLVSIWQSSSLPPMFIFTSTP